MHTRRLRSRLLLLPVVVVNAGALSLIHGSHGHRVFSALLLLVATPLAVHLNDALLRVAMAIVMLSPLPLAFGMALIKPRPQGSGIRSNHRYDSNYYQQEQLSQQEAPFSPQALQQPGETNESLVRLCYCDQPVNPDSAQCVANHFCVDRPGFYCSRVLVNAGSMQNVLGMTFMLDRMARRNEPL
jgi:hypothetical protein